MKSNRVYLDNAATTMVHPQVRELVSQVLSGDSANPSSIHSSGMKARILIEKSRRQIANAIQAPPARLFFTSCGTESNNLAILGYCAANRHKGSHLITSRIEHPSVLESFRWLEANGFRVTYLAPDDEGFVSPQDVEKNMQRDTLLVSIMHANNEVGTVQDIRSIGRLCRARQVVFHSDATQSFCKMPLSVVEDEVDMLTLSSHKIHGPKGAGALYVRDTLTLRPLLLGGGHEDGLRSGTHNVEAIAGFGLAAEITGSASRSHVQNLRRELWKQLQERIDGVFLNGSETRSLDGILNVYVKNVEALKVLHALDKKGIQISAGSACSAGKKTASHVLKAMGHGDVRASETLRFSVGMYNTGDEVSRAVDELSSIVEKLRGDKRVSA